jgi:AraC-like DNA-binding protein
MAADPAQPAHTISAAYGLHLIDLLTRWGVTAEQLLEGTGVRREELADPGRSLPLDVAIDIFDRARLLTGDDALGIYLGLQMPASAHGILGFATMSAKTVGEAIAMSIRYAAIRTTAISMHTRMDGAASALVLVEEADLRGAREGYLLTILLGLWRMGRVFTGKGSDLTLDLRFPEPLYYRRFVHALPATRFDQPENRLVLHDLSHLADRISTADEASFRLARDQCDEILRSMGLDGRLAPRVRALLAKQEGALPELEAVARSLRVAPRSFRRRLEAEQVTFSGLLDAERKRRAMLLLRSRDLSVEQIGERLGYAHVANFTRAFRRWTGKTPKAYRQSGPTG